MLFFFKEKPIEVIALCRENQRYAFEYSPATPAKDMFPRWWKETSSGSFNWETMNPFKTVKSCVGIINQLSTGMILPLWCDLAVKWNKHRYEYMYSDNFSRADVHLAPGFMSDYFIFKLVSPWVMKSKVKLQYMYPHYHYNSPPNYIIPPGIVTPVNEYSACNVFMYLKKEEAEQQLLIKSNTPLLQVIPLTDKKVVYRVEIMSKTEEIKANNTAGALNHFISGGLKRIFSEQQKK